MVCDEAVDAGAFWSGFKATGDFRSQLQFASSYQRTRPDYLLFSKEELDSIIDDIRSVGYALTDFCVDLQDAEPAKRSEVKVKGE